MEEENSESLKLKILNAISGVNTIMAIWCAEGIVYCKALNRLPVGMRIGGADLNSATLRTDCAPRK
jgi:hypothetical protein